MAHVVKRQASSALRSLLSTPATFATRPSRSFSSSSARHENIEETYKWRKITAVAYVVCTAFGIYSFAGEEHHEHHDTPAYPYLHIRNKEFPWGPDGLFERKHGH